MFKVAERVFRICELFDGVVIIIPALIKLIRISVDTKNIK
jgi:hypothetical protein